MDNEVDITHISTEARPVQKAGYHLEEMDGELLLYHLNETQIMYCNETAGLIWRLCDGCLSVGELVAALSAAYPEAADTMAADIQKALQAFQAAGCIELR